MIPNPKKIALDIESQEQYLAALATSGLHSKRHGRLKNEIKNQWVTQKKDITPKDLTELLKMTEGYVNDEAMRVKLRYDPNKAGVALVDSSDRWQRGGRNNGGQDMTGIANKSGKTGCNHCRDPKHWLENFLNRHVTGADHEVLRKKTHGRPTATACWRGEGQRR